jgi:hypothetical protein
MWRLPNPWRVELASDTYGCYRYRMHVKSFFKLEIRTLEAFALTVDLRLDVPRD